MFRKILKLNIVFISLFLFKMSVIEAYDFIDSNNSTGVGEMINEIYDAKQQYEDLAGEAEETIEIYDATSTSYWWPIGSSETTESNGKLYATGNPETVSITSEFGYRDDPFNRGKKLHSGVDISGGSGQASVNIIASKSGIVVYPTADVSNNCPSSTSLSDCGGGYGNYVIIQHSDGNYTLYGHMYENSITVKAGDNVEQGQVIGKMGSSGNSTGDHLHFEVREGQNTSSATTDPLTYISAEKPRLIITTNTGSTTTGGGDILAWLNSWEGHTRIDGDYYIVENIGDGVRTVGGGITLENNVSGFKKYGIDVNNYPEGSKIPISIVDQLELEVIDSKRNYIQGVLSDNSIVLAENQIEALISQMYNTGNINGFSSAYKQYGNTDAFYNNWFFRAIMRGTKFEAGLTRRRNAEWSLFHTGEYVYNG